MTNEEKATQKIIELLKDSYPHVRIRCGNFHTLWHDDNTWIVSARKEVIWRGANLLSALECLEEESK